MLVRIRPFLDLDNIVAALISPKVTNNFYIKKFEKTFAAFIGSPKAYATHQGRSALLLALKILDIKQNDEVIVQSFNISFVIDAILEVGAIPVLVDSNLDDFNMSPSAIKKRITTKTKAIIVTHLGIPCDIEEISNISKENNCFLVEDCALALGASYKKRNVGTFGDLAFFSFDIDKPFTTGEGGMLVINNINLLEKAQHILSQYERIPLEKEREIIYGLLIQHLVTEESVYPKMGLEIDFGKNIVKKDQYLKSLIERLVIDCCEDSFQGHFLLSYISEKKYFFKKNLNGPDRLLAKTFRKIKKVPQIIRRDKIESKSLLMNSVRSVIGLHCLNNFKLIRDIRYRNTELFANLLDKNMYILPHVDKNKKPTFLRYNVLNNTNYELREIRHAARAKGFELGIFNWDRPIHLRYPYNKILSFDRKMLENSEHLGKKLISLPIHPYVNEQMIKDISKFLNSLR